MTNEVQDLFERALKLSVEERIHLTHLLEHAADEEPVELSQEWREEIARRVELIVKGEAGPGKDWESVVEGIRKRRAERSA